MRSIMYLMVVLSLLSAVSAGAVEIRVDFGGSGVLDDNWSEWNASSGSTTIDDITLTLSNGGHANGPKVRIWSDGGDNLTKDALAAEDPGGGGWYQIEITGLAQGADYTMTSYHNVAWKAGSFPGGNVSMKLNGSEVDTCNIPERQDYENAGVCEFTFTAGAGSDTFRWDFDQMAWLNGFELLSQGGMMRFASEESGDFEYVSPAGLEVILTGAQEGQVYTVDYAVIGGTATKDDDYNLESGTLTFGPGETSKNINIGIIDDGLDEDDETIVVELSNPVGADAVLGRTVQHTYTIIDPRPEVGFERDRGRNPENAGVVDIPVNLSFAAIQTVTVDYAVTGGTATGGGVDYTLNAGTLTFSPGETSKPISIAVVDDGEKEQNETIVVTLSNISAGGLPASITEHTVTLVDSSSLNLKIDLALPFWNGSEDYRDWDSVPIPETLKDGWIPWAAGRWGDMYGHGAVAMKDVAGTGIGMMISTVYGGLSAMKAAGMCMPRLNGGTPFGSPIHDPICNSWFQVEDKPMNPGGDIVMALYGLPAGEYELYSYHNNFECHRAGETSEGTAACCDQIANPQPLMPTITAVSLAGLIDRYADYEWWPRWMDPRSEFINCMPGAQWDHPVCEYMGDGVETIEGAYNVQVQQVTSDEDLVPSLIRFRTNGSAVHIIYESGCCVPDGIRSGRSGGRAILNAFELRAAGPELCPCAGDLNGDGQIDLDDLQAVAGVLLDAGSPFIVPVGAGHCGNLNGDEQIDLEDLQAVAGILLDAGSPFIVQCD